MGTFRRKLLLNTFKIFDLVLMLCAFSTATLVALRIATSAPRHPDALSLTQLLAIRIKVQNLVLLVAFVVIWHVIFSAVGLYESKRLSSRRRYEMIDLFKATTLGTAFLAVMALIFQIALVNSNFVIVFWVACVVPGLASRLLLRYVLARLRTHHRNLRCMLVVGTNPRAVAFARRVESKPELGYRIVGFADSEWNGLTEFRRTGYPLACGLEDFPNLLRRTVVDEVVMGLPVKSCYHQASRIAAACEEQGILVRFPSSIFDLKLARTKAEEFDGDPVITLSTGSLHDWPAAVKRAIDLLVSLALIVALAPVYLLTAVLIKLTSRGPVFFRQKRLGLNKRVFYIHKFRTMVVDAEQRQAELEKLNEVSGPVFKIKNDPRITPLGRFLRKTSIDELPQLFNVVKGEMSLVGPRPLPVRDYEGFDRDWQRRRFSVRPGITCLWQINGRNSIPFEQWMELDMEYIDKWSLWLDLKILYRTIPAVLKGSGAA
ncbi:MAG TPA: sugar transferase [Terriglobales bacterium]|nr:sugar transferase [Terriglobales bacterium]